MISNDFHSPLRIVVDASLLSIGAFIIWAGVFYYLSNVKAKKLFELLMCLFCCVALTDYLFFGTDLGILSAELQYSEELSFTSSEKIINLLVLLALSILVILICHKKKSIMRPVLLIFTAAVIGMSAINVIKIQSAVPEIRQAISSASDEKASFRLSKNGKNVIVLMLDRAVGAYLPYIFQEDTELVKQFDGFTYYPNTLAFGEATNFASPALFGGYEYTPEELNRRADELLADKHDEALKVMPVIFSNEGYEVTVCDPSYAGYGIYPDLSIYDEYPGIRTFITEQGQFSLDSDSEQMNTLSRTWERNFFCYSIMKVSPVILQPHLYYYGTYLQATPFFQTIYGISRATGLNNSFINSFAVLCSLPEISRISDSADNTFLMMVNSTTHDAAMLSEPDYYPAQYIDNTEYDAANSGRFIIDGKKMRVETYTQMIFYQANMAALKQLGKWFDYLRENDVFDNTRIIIAADHGYGLKQFDDLLLRDERNIDIVYFNPLLLVKDFNSEGFSSNYEFMTNADVPSKAMKDIMPKPINPFTGKVIDSSAKSSHDQHVFSSNVWQTDENYGNTFIPGRWYAVHDDIFDPENWSYLGIY